MTQPIDLFFNRQGRLRSGWRCSLFIVFYLIFATLLSGLLHLAGALGLPAPFAAHLLEGNKGFVLRVILLMLVPATLLGWACNHALEDLPPRALGWGLHRGWLRDALIGVCLGSLSLAAAALVGVAVGGLRFTFEAAALGPAVLRTLAVSGFIFAVGAAAEEAMFRGYPLQTLLRSLPAWFAVLPPALLFASGHLLNPNAVRGFTFLNTALAGVWLSIAYLRTRSLWFPLGLHWGWNWTMGALLGLPVSGLTSIAPAPLLRSSDAGPVWLTGGSYGLEGGAACTVALLVSSIFILRTRLVSATEELKRMTDEEQPNPPATLRGTDPG